MSEYYHTAIFNYRLISRNTHLCSYSQQISTVIAISHCSNSFNNVKNWQMKE